MELQVTIHANEEQKEVVERLIGENLKNKLNNYLNKFEKSNLEGKLDFNIEKNKKGLFNAKLQINIDGKSFRFEREDYKKLDDLVNNLFDHFKEELSKK